jgi:hypothetical protein
MAFAREVEDEPGEEEPERIQQDLGEIDVLIEESFPVSPQVRGAFRSLPGVIEVEEI